MCTVKRYKLEIASAAVAALLPILSGRAGAAPLPGLTPERVLAGPCAPGASYDASCDVDHDGDVDIFDIQLTAGHWNRTGNWTTQSVPMLARMNGIPPTFDQQVTYGAPSGTSVANVNEDSVSLMLRSDVGLVYDRAGGSIYAPRHAGSVC